MSQTQLGEEAVPQNPSILAVGDGTRPNGTILLVEDENLVREVTCEVLESEGYRVPARNAAEAMDIFLPYKKIVQLLLTDVVLPGQNGRDLAKGMRAVCPSLKTIFMSGYPENAVPKHGLREDGMFYLPKPFSAESLMRKVNRVLEEREEGEGRDCVATECRP